MMAQLQQEKDKLNLAPKRFNMWLIIFSSFMLFAALTSGFIVYSGGKGHGINTTLPVTFIYSTAVIIISSITMWLATRSAKQLQFTKQRLYTWVTIVLGLLFLGLQYYSWSILVRMGVYFSNPNASQSFIYVFTGIHLVHIIAGLVLLFNSLAGSYRNIPQVFNLFRLERAGIFWHFLDIIWIYLYVFLLLNQY
jgi:cytochrome c oxidase subunit 3